MSPISVQEFVTVSAMVTITVVTHRVFADFIHNLLVACCHYKGPNGFVSIASHSCSDFKQRKTASNYKKNLYNKLYNCHERGLIRYQELYYSGIVPSGTWM